MNGRPWTDSERDRVRAEYGTVPAAQLAKSLGRPLSSVYQMAHKLDRVERRVCASDQQIINALRELHPQGYNDTEISLELERRLELDVDRHRVGQLRKSIGLPMNKVTQRYRQRVRQNTRRQLQAAGVDTLAQVRLQQWNKWKRDLGWPEHLSIRAVQSLEMFYRHGALTRVQLCQLLGVSSRKRTAPISNAPGGTVLAELQRAGLISRVRKGKKIPFDTKVHDQPWGNRQRTSGRKIRFKHLDVYVLNPGVEPHGRKANECTSAG